MRGISVIKRKPNNRIKHRIHRNFFSPSSIINHETGVEKNSAIALLKFAGAWQGNDLPDLLKEVKSTRSIIEF